MVNPNYREFLTLSSSSELSLSPGWGEAEEEGRGILEYFFY